MSAGARHLEYSKRALREIDAARTWWRANRNKAPDALDEDLARTLLLIREQPEIGGTIGSGSGLRRVLLSRVRYHLYYRISQDGTKVFVLSLWHTSRAQGPVL